MAFSYGFFNAQLDSNGDYDRIYQAEHFAEYFHLFVGNGVFPDGATQLQVVSTIPASMKVSVSAGFGWINGYYAKNTSDFPLTIAVAHASLPRRDIVVLRWVSETRKMELAVKTGTAASSPVVPAPTRNADVYELRLATISVAAGATSISQSAITDNRPDTAVCGWVTGLIDQIDTTNLFAQYNAAFTEWFDNVKAQLSGNVATNLQNQIDDLYTKAAETVPISRGGTGQTTAPKGLYNLINGSSALTNTSLATSDYLALLDSSAATGKKITVANLANFLNVTSGLTKIQVGSYTGTGTYGASNPNSITCSFAPKFIWIYGMDGFIGAINGYINANSTVKTSKLSTSFQLMKNVKTGFIGGSTSSNDSYVNLMYIKKSSDGKTITWYCNGSESATSSTYKAECRSSQCNNSGKEYQWIAIG